MVLVYSAQTIREFISVAKQQEVQDITIKPYYWREKGSHTDLCMCLHSDMVSYERVLNWELRMATHDLQKLAKSLADDLSKRGFSVKTEAISTRNGEATREMEVEDFNYFLKFI